MTLLALIADAFVSGLVALLCDILSARKESR